MQRGVVPATQLGGNVANVAHHLHLPVPFAVNGASREQPLTPSSMSFRFLTDSQCRTSTTSNKILPIMPGRISSGTSNPGLAIADKDANRF